MPRLRPDDRFDDLVRAAVEVFIAQGYRRTQVADIARVLGVAKGTVYLYVDSKQTLFDLSVRYAASPRTLSTPEQLPVRGIDASETLRFVRAQLRARGSFPALAAALERRRVTDVRAELEDVVRELYRMLAANRLGIKLLDRCASDYPELAALFYGVARERLPAMLRSYIDVRAARRWFRRFPDTAVAARIVMETATFWAVHRHWDPAPQAVDDRVAEDTVVQFVCGALLRE
jgi:AcrR family transcriptional regulator